MKNKLFLISIFIVIVAYLVYLVLSEKPVTGKYQEPKLPYPYHSEEVTFNNAQDGITLSGTLTLPKKQERFPAVILITGSGPQNRNEEVFGHKPFLVIADYLTRQGLAVLRYDDRGTGKSTGIFMTATSLDFAADAESAVSYLKSRKEIDPKKIGLVGHSEGALVAAITAAQSEDVNFVISLAGPGVKCIEVANLQAELIARAGGVDEEGISIIKKTNREITDILSKSTDTTVLRTDLTAYARANLQSYPMQMIPPSQTKKEFSRNQINVMCSPWYQFLYKTDPAAYFEKITCPVLALNGSKDLQVDAKQNLPAILKAARNGGNVAVTVKELPNLNHFFQESKTGHTSEYAVIQETFSLTALAIMSVWIAKQIK
jgi:pimeloyl-ACP methyl ester carboxylesterase